MKRILPLLVLLLGAATAQATETRVTVRAFAHDAKLIGNEAGGCAITLRDAHTGEILAKGIQSGKTGDTDRIVREPWIRGDDRFDTDGAAAFTATLDLDAPTLVTVEARGPLGFGASAVSASRNVLLLPGHHLDGNGIVLTLQGLIVSLQEPDPEDELRGGETLQVEAGVKLLCTCPIGPETPWKSDDYTVTAELRESGELLASAELVITDRVNVFAGSLELPAVEEGESRILELRINAANDRVGNFGTDAVVFRVGG